MKLFLIDGSREYSYENLLIDINISNSFKPILQTDDLYEYLVNTLTAVANNKSLILVDSTNKIEELKEIGIKDVNQEVSLEKAEIPSAHQLIQDILSSTSTITIFTSGTTGQPKKVSHSIMNLTRAVRRSDKHLEDVWGFAYNPTHMAGIQVIFQAITNFNTLVNIFNKDREYVNAMITKFGISHISATPTFYRLLLPYEKPFNSVRRITFGGEKSDSSLYNHVTKIFPNAMVTNIYASTEAGSLFAAKGDVFQLPSGMEDKFKVEDGELLIHKSLLGESDSFSYKDDFYCSGDLVEWIDEKKRLFKFKSRKNELLNIGGYKVNPEEIEGTLSKIEGVQQSKVYGRANSILGTVLCADIKMTENANLTIQVLRQELTKSLQDYKIPRKIKFVESFELTRTGKLKRT